MAGHQYNLGVFDQRAGKYGNPIGLVTATTSKYTELSSLSAIAGSLGRHLFRADKLLFLL
jgi:hypothetical protein